MSTKEAKMQRFWNVAAIILYGVFLPLSCLFLIVGESIPIALILFWFFLPYIEHSGMEHLRQKELKR